MEQCRQLKEEYDNCFNLWFSQKFLKGDDNDEICAPLLKVYKECVKRTMKENNIEMKEIDKPVLGTPEEKKAPP
ncbi:TP53-regulated inhibitor of apoptosis 1-B-like [Homalodisca vitripennis]|uniref:TP53-regulated inhibitor of apoptosis 1-B-like n=1 Tax=Homalodisca vitripennis TaxID=197043 RepID=UPI001EEA304D|nr:TP53-regulated inhibitor of apoptosis 1-B-like [Homalodisca vitripennis]